MDDNMRMTDRQMLAEIASQLENGIEETWSGGWSTHQVRPMRALADEINRQLAGRAPQAPFRPAELLREGGAWLYAAREWMQDNCHNGDSVAWGSAEEMRPTMRAVDMERFAAHVAAAALNVAVAVVTGGRKE